MRDIDIRTQIFRGEDFLDFISPFFAFLDKFIYLCSRIIVMRTPHRRIARQTYACGKRPRDHTNH